LDNCGAKSRSPPRRRSKVKSLPTTSQRAEGNLLSQNIQLLPFMLVQQIALLPLPKHSVRYRSAKRGLPNIRTAVQFIYSDLPSTKNTWWLVIEPDGEVDLCWSDPGFEINLYVTTDLRTMTAIWMGLGTLESEKDKIELMGERQVAETMQLWLGLSSFAKQKKLVA
jgi:hypothetical protein